MLLQYKYAKPDLQGAKPIVSGTGPIVTLSEFHVKICSCFVQILAKFESFSKGPRKFFRPIFMAG